LAEHGRAFGRSVAAFGRGSPRAVNFQTKIERSAGLRVVLPAGRETGVAKVTQSQNVEASESLAAE